jgi:hypothetical protein
MTRRPGPEYHVTVTIHAPLPFVFQWCTDYTAGDASLEGERFERRVLERTKKRIVFEDLDRDRDGWIWKRFTVTLRPPNAWTAESIGNRRQLTLHYGLSDAGDGRTRLDLRWKRRPSLLPTHVPSKATIERDSTAGWRRLARALERDYRQGSGGGPA